MASEKVLDLDESRDRDKHGPGASKAEIVEALRREETNRGLTFEYCLITAGTSPQPRAFRTASGEGRHHVDR